MSNPILTVKTFTRHSHPELLERCKASVQAALPTGAVHEIVYCPSDAEYPILRYNHLKTGGLVAFVDDDDTIHHLALKACLAAFKEHPAVGLVFTNEVTVDTNNVPVGLQITRDRSYEWISYEIRHIHHLTVFRSDAVTSIGARLHDQFGVGIDWFTRSVTALVHGAVHIPMPGLRWTRADQSHSHRTSDMYVGRQVEMGRAIRQSAGDRKGPIPKFIFTD